MSSRKGRTSSAPVKANSQSKPSLDQIKALVEDLPEEQKLQVVEQVHSTAMSYQGPLPHPKDLEQYEQTLPGAAERILSMAEKEQSIREKQASNFYKYKRLQVNWAGIVALGLIVVSGIAAWLGNESIAIPLGVVGLASLIVRLIYEWAQQRKA